MTRAAIARALALAGTMLAVALPSAAASAASPSAGKPLKLTVYALPATVQFMNHADDRLRGHGGSFQHIARGAIGRILDRMRLRRQEGE